MRAYLLPHPRASTKSYPLPAKQTPPGQAVNLPFPLSHLPGNQRSRISKNQTRKSSSSMCKCTGKPTVASGTVHSSIMNIISNRPTHPNVIFLYTKIDPQNST